MLGDRRYYVGARLAARRELRKQGLSNDKIQAAIDACTDEVIDLAAEDAKVGAVVELPGAIGDGTILQKIIDFFNSPTGQALMAALIKLLLSFIGA